MTCETWKPVPGWGHYSVSNRGNVRATVSRRPLKVNIDSGGYAQVKLYPAEVGARKWTVVVHRLVLAAFKRLPKKGEHGMHRNDDRSDNRLINLRWGTKKQNTADMVKKGRVKRAPAKRPRLTAQEVEAIQRCPDEKLADLAQRFNTSKSNVSKVRAKSVRLRSPETPVIWRTS